MMETENNQTIPRSSFLVFLLSLIFIIAFVHIGGMHFGIYERFLQLDSVLHFLGGLWIGLASIWFFFVSQYVKPLRTTKWRILFVSLISAAVIGLFWEYFEILIDISFYVEKYAADTKKDLILDLLGSFIGASYIIRRYLR